MWIIVGLVIIALVVGGIYWYLGKQQPSEVTQSITQAKSTPQPEVNYDQELNSVDIATPEADFNSVDKDLQSL